MTGPRAPLVLGLLLGTGLVAPACKGGKATEVAGVDRGPNPKAARAPTVVGHYVASVDDRAVGPFMAARPGAAAMVGWLSPGEGTGRRVVVIPLADNGDPSGPERTVATTALDTTTLIVRPMHGPAPGFVLAWTVLTDKGRALWSVAVGDDGKPRTKAIELARTTDDIVWVDVVPTDHGAVCLWAEETQSGDANIVTASLDTDGKVRRVPGIVARGATGWHALEMPGGVGLSTVFPVSAASRAPAAHKPLGKSQPRGGALSFLKLDVEGLATGQPVIIAPDPTVSGDVEVVRADKKLVFAWTDRTAEESFVAGAMLDDAGAVTAPRRLVEGRGGAALLGLSPAGAGATLMWESPPRRGNEPRQVQIASISPSLKPSGRIARLEAAGRSSPELVGRGNGASVLATVADCEPGSADCEGAPSLPSLLRFDANGTLVQREALTFGSDPASLAWGLSCDEERCLTLAASGAAPARVRAAEIRTRENVRGVATRNDTPRAPVGAPDVDAPEIADLTASVSGENVIDAAVARVGGKTLLATLATKPEAPSKPRVDDGTRLLHVVSARIVDESGTPSAPVILSTRALSIGGIAAAFADKPEDGGVVAWVAREGGDPEVHLTRVDKQGRKLGDVRLTTTRGDANDVAVAYAGGGFVVAWVDTRDGNGEVYTARVGLDLRRVGGEERFTKAPGDASDLVAVRNGDNVWLAWADPRDNTRDGLADVFVGAVRASDARRSIDEVRLLGTVAHSRTPTLSAAGDGVHVAWIEEAPQGVAAPGTSGYGAMFATLDGGGRLVAKPVKLPSGGEGASTAVVIDGAAASPRFVVVRSALDSLSLDAVELTHRGAWATPVLALDGPPSLDVALAMDRGTLYFNDDGPELRDKRVRRAQIAWKR